MSNYHLTTTSLRKHQGKLVQLDQLMKFSERKTKDFKQNEEFSKQIELLGDRWKELPSTSSYILHKNMETDRRRKSLRFDESALNDTNEERQLLGGKYEVKQRATSKGEQYDI
jgi:hypothetical protein